MRRLVAFALLVAACGEIGRERVELALLARGTAARPVELAGGARLLLTRADLAFGPAYFCASNQGRAELCEVALLELRESGLVHALEPSPLPLGTLRGTTGEVRSAVFDYGITWLLTQNQPRVSSAAPGGHSALLEGTLERAGSSLRFVVRLDVQPSGRGDAALNSQRTQHLVTVEDERVTLQVDPHRWVDRLDPDALFALDVDGDGQIEITAGSPGYESILQGLVNRAPVSFVWGE